MLKRSLIILGITAAVLVVSACSGTETLSQKNWGKSYETATYNQMLNPDADKTQKPVDSLDAQAANNTVKKYQDSFKTKGEKKTTTVINLGNLGTK